MAGDMACALREARTAGQAESGKPDRALIGL
jgi:hypothetical protein